ncbi:hypothetical protein EV183_003622 [Coemansia sp. RSA 2336]|nr:hypothetical protein EV183_003622 [Coemansia sp. RSA 2336]
MMQTKRARLSSDANDIGRFLEISVKQVIQLSSNIQNVSAIAAWTPSQLRQTSANASSKPNTPCFVIGTSTGGISLVYENGIEVTLENPGGPAVVRLLAKDSTAPQMETSQSSTKSMPDIIAGDADGRVTAYVLGQVFSRITLPAPISALSLDLNPNTPSSFLAGDMSGTVASCHTQNTLWKAQMDSLVLSMDLRSSSDQLLDPAVSSTCSVWLPDKHGLLTNYVLAASALGFLQLLSRGIPIHTISLRAPAVCMCSGVFIESEAHESPGSKNTQAIIGDEMGQLLVLENFELVLYAQMEFPISHLFALPMKLFVDQEGPDVVVCATRSDTIYVLHRKKVIATYTADFWPAAVDVTVLADTGPALVLVDSDSGNGSVHVVSLK